MDCILILGYLILKPNFVPKKMIPVSNGDLFLLLRWRTKWWCDWALSKHAIIQFKSLRKLNSDRNVNQSWHHTIVILQHIITCARQPKTSWSLPAPTRITFEAHLGDKDFGAPNTKQPQITRENGSWIKTFEFAPPLSPLTLLLGNYVVIL